MIHSNTVRYWTFSGCTVTVAFHTVDRFPCFRQDFMKEFQYYSKTRQPYCTVGS